MDIYLIRHTKVAVEGYCYGQTDVELFDTFEQEAEVVKKKLELIPHDAVFASPLSRCVRLLEYCGYGEEAQYREGLKELNFGDWEMKRWEQMDMKEWESDWINVPTPNGESFREMYERVVSFLDELKSRNYKSIKIFTHGGVINCVKVYFGLCSLEDAFNRLAAYGEVLRFEL